MKTNSFHKLASAAMGLIFLMAGNASAATIIVAENFGGTSADLQGKTADTWAGAITTASGSSNWQANTDFNQDGTVVGTSSSSSAYLNLGTYINDAKGTASGKFVLTATISPTTGSWLSLGFASENTPNLGKNFTNTGGGLGTTGYATMVYRNDGDIDQWAGATTAGEVASTENTLYTGSRTLSITLDFTTLGGYNGTSNFGTVTFADSVAGTFGSHTYNTNAAIGSILLSQANSSTGTYSALTLTQIPEPSTAVLLGGLGLLALLRRRR